MELKQLPLSVPAPLPQNKKKLQKNLFTGVGLATLSVNRYNMAQGLLRRCCFKYLNIMKKLPLPLPQHLKKADNRVVSLSRIGWLNFSDQF